MKKEKCDCGSCQQGRSLKRWAFACNALNCATFSHAGATAATFCIRRSYGDLVINLLITAVLVLVWKRTEDTLRAKAKENRASVAQEQDLQIMAAMMKHLRDEFSPDAKARDAQEPN